MIIKKPTKVRISSFKPYKPSYNFFDFLFRSISIFRAIVGTVWIMGKSKLINESLSFGSSLEITDKCNAGCNYCYVYPEDWDQSQRVRGYMKLSAEESLHHTKTLYGTLDKISSEGKVLITLVGGEPTLSPNLIEYAGSKFPVVWVVTNGSKSLPKTLKSVVYFVSVDGPPQIHNKNRDPANFFKGHTYKNLSGLSAAIVRNINDSDRGAYIHITLTKKSISTFEETVHWLCRDVVKLRGIVVSGAASSSIEDPFVLSPEDRLRVKSMIESLALEYGWDLFPFNKPVINSYLFDPKNIIYSPNQCTVARRVDSYNFEGKSTGKCVLRDEIDCQTCVCNISGLMRGVSSHDLTSIRGLLSTCFG